MTTLSKLVLVLSDDGRVMAVDETTREPAFTVQLDSDKRALLVRSYPVATSFGISSGLVVEPAAGNSIRIHLS